MFPNGSSKFFYRTKPSLIFKTRSLTQRTPTNFGLCANHRLLGRARFFSSSCIRELRRDGPDPYHYTSGRWLRKDAIQQESHFLHFDFDALCLKVLALCPNSTSITSYDKKEGGFNRVFIFHTDSAERIVARLPFGSAGPPRLSTNSEVATIKYLQAETEVPIPKILDWSDNPSNPIGSEYIIMEHAPGIRLLEKWPTMDMDQQIRFAGLIAKQLAEMANIKFPAYGSLYFADTPYLPPSKLPFNEEFCIGPHCGHMYWNCMPIQPKFYHDVKPNQGPWTNLADYTDGLIDSGISRIPPLEPAVKRPRYKGSIETHKSLLKEARTMLKEMSKSPKIQSVASPAMFHPSLDKRNIFVSEDDPTIVTSIIDWQSTSIEPAFWYANQFPDFTHPPPDIFDFLDSNPLISARARAYHISLRIFATNFSTARSMEESFLRPFVCCQRTWEDGAAFFCQELIETSEVWKELGLASQCPFSPPLHDELAVHKKDHRRFKASQELLDALVSLLNVSDEGWVPLKDWEDTKVAHQKAFRDFLQEVHELDQPDDDDPIQSEDDLRELWPFDLEE